MPPAQAPSGMTSSPMTLRSPAASSRPVPHGRRLTARQMGKRPAKRPKELDGRQPATTWPRGVQVRPSLVTPVKQVISLYSGKARGVDSVVDFGSPVQVKADGHAIGFSEAVRAGFLPFLARLYSP